MNQNVHRVGNFTSSEIVNLFSLGKREMTEEELAAHKLAFPKSKAKMIESWPGKACLTYIEECNMERKLGRSISSDATSRPTSWGNLVETRIFELLGPEYEMKSLETMRHPSILYWSGSPDAIKHDEGKTVVDFKCPFTLKSFCILVRALYSGLEGMEAMNALRNGFKDKKTGKEYAAHDDGEKFYWQLVSNAVLAGAKYAELIIYVPYFSELKDIKESTEDYPKLNRVAWIQWSEENELPWLVEEKGYYNNINIIRFEVPQEDKDLLTAKVLEAGKLLDPFHDEVEQEEPTV